MLDTDYDPDRGLGMVESISLVPNIGVPVVQRLYSFVEQLCREDGCLLCSLAPLQGFQMIYQRPGMDISFDYLLCVLGVLLSMEDTHQITHDIKHEPVAPFLCRQVSIQFIL